MRLMHVHLVGHHDCVEASLLARAVAIAGLVALVQAEVVVGISHVPSVLPDVL